MDDQLQTQSLEIAELLPILIRRLFLLETEGPTADLPVAQLRACGLLRSGQRSMSELSRDLGISLSAVTQLADRLERSGLVERVTERGDHRIKCIQLTDHGRQVVGDRARKRTERIRAVLSRLSPEDRQMALDGLKALSNAAQDTGSDVTDLVSAVESAVC